MYIYNGIVALLSGVRFGGHDQERGHTSVNRSCVLALRSVTYLTFGRTRLQPRISVGSALVQDGGHSKQTILERIDWK